MTRLAYLALGIFAGVVITLSLVYRREPACPTCDAVERGLDDARTGQTVTWDRTWRVTMEHPERTTDTAWREPDDDSMCPNCVTPWKCNGPHVPWPPSWRDTLEVHPV